MGDTNRFSMVAYTGAVFDRGWWGRIVFDLSGIRTGERMPCLREHAADRPVGVIDRIVKSGRILTAQGSFLSTRDGNECKELLNAGYPMQASIGIWSDEVEEVREGNKASVNGETFVGPGVIWRKSHLREISMVSLGADSDTSIQIAASAAAGRFYSMSNEPRRYEDAIQLFMNQGIPRGEAVVKAAIEYPLLHEEFIERSQHSAVTIPTGGRR